MAVFLADAATRSPMPSLIIMIEFPGLHQFLSTTS